jgi:small subunit ribosomal protein S4
MSRYRGPKLRIIRRLGQLPGLTSKISKKLNAPGQHGPSNSKKKPSLENYGIRLHEKQKLRFNYGVSEKQLYSYVKEARRLKGSTGLNILKFLEMRLDNIVYRLGIVSTIASARQLVTHGHILLNGKSVNIPSLQCKVNDLILLNTTQNILKLAKYNLKEHNLLGSHLWINSEKVLGKVTALVSRENLILTINDLFIVEYYSRK